MSLLQLTQWLPAYDYGGWCNCSGAASPCSETSSGARQEALRATCLDEEVVASCLTTSQQLAGDPGCGAQEEPQD